MSKELLWHGSDHPIPRFDSAGVLHVGTLGQAVMRSSGAYLHLVEFDAGRVRRIRDKGSDNARAITRARRDGIDVLKYLNRYEGMETDKLVAALDRHPGMDFDKLTDAQFRKLFPGMKDSQVIVDPSRARVVGCYRGENEARRGYTERITMGGDLLHRRPAAAEMSFDDWLGVRTPVIVAEEDFGFQERRYIEDARERLLGAASCLDFDAPDIPGLACKEICVRDDVRFVSAPNALLALNRDDGSLAGGISMGVVYVEPDRRGSGLGTLLHVVNEENRILGMRPDYFFRGGFAARRAAHRMLCERALDRGDPVLGANLEAHGLTRDTFPDPLS